METAEFVEVLRSEGALLAGLAERAEWDAVVPACPKWRTRDLVHHVGSVHRWATHYARGATAPVAFGTEGPVPDAESAAWFRAGHETLTEALAAAPAGLAAWTFMPAASPLAFWARRQAHETAIHRVDAEQAADAAHIPFGAAFAADGVDELLRGFLASPRGRLRSAAPASVRIRATDAGRSWLLRLSDGPLRVEDDDASPADCTVAGPADDLYLALWNRSGFDALDVRGDAAPVAAWRTTAVI